MVSKNQMNVIIGILFLFTVLIIIVGVSNSKTTKESEISVEMNVSKTPDGKPLVEYHVSAIYSTNVDNWMKEYALEHRTSSQEELHLFTFSDGKQFEYWMSEASAAEKGFLYPSSWTEELDESLSPSKINEQQFNENLNQLMSKWDGACFEWQADEIIGERLYVYTGQPLTGLSIGDEASFLKNYIDLKPDRDEYGIIIQAPSADGQTITKALEYQSKDHTLLEAEITSSGSKSGIMWTDATYTSIVNAIKTNTFTNHPGKEGVLQF